MDLFRDLRHAARRLARERGFALVAILTLAVGIGANTAIFSLVDGVLLRPLAYPHAEQLVSIHESVPQFAQQYPEIPVDAPAFNAWRQRSQRLSALALVEPDTYDLTGDGEPRQIVGADVSFNIFRLLGAAPKLGRAFLAEEDQPGRNREVILSDAFWRSQFHADPGILSRSIDLNGHPTQIVGVMPASFRFPHGQELGPLLGDANADPGPMQVFLPVGIDFAHTQEGGWNYGVFARLRPGASAAGAQAELQGITAAMPVDPQIGPVHTSVLVEPLRDQVVGNHRLGLLLLLAAVGAILAIVCLNLANLLLVRVHGRGHENAIRLALGASRARLLRETMAEGILLALTGGALGIGGAFAALRWLVATAPTAIPRLDEVGLDLAALAFALLLALVSGVLFSLWPAWRAGSTNPQGALRAGGRGSSEAGKRVRARDWLVGAQCALTAMLLVVAGLLAASYLDLMGVKKGFAAGHVLEVSAEWSAGKRDQRVAFFHAALEKLRALPGVQAAGMTDAVPLQGTLDHDTISLPGDTRPMLDHPLANFSDVDAGYFASLGIPLRRGHTFTAAEIAGGADLPKAPDVPAVVSAATAAKLWPGTDPIGRLFVEYGSKRNLRVVGVVGDVRSEGLQTPPALTVYVPYTFNVPDSVSFTLRTAADPMALASAARDAIWSVQPVATIPAITTMDDVVAASVASRRFQMSLVVAFALAALLLAALGVYGVIAYAVARRTQEIGIRIALGADAANLYALVLRQGLAPVAAGLVAGIAAALAAGRLLASLLYGVGAADPIVIAAVALLLLLAGILACALPARRAARLDPLAALRQE